MFITENNIKLGDNVRVVNPTKYKEHNRSGEFIWLGTDLMEVGATKTVTQIIDKYTVRLSKGYVYDIDWIEPVTNYELISNQLASM